MKIWKFYKRQSDEVVKKAMLAGNDTAMVHPLVAFTCDKSTRNEFVSQRDMKNYIEIVTKDVDKDEYKEFANNAHNRGCLLEYYTLNTKYWDSYERMGITNDPEDETAPDGVTILATSSEMNENEGNADAIIQGYAVFPDIDELQWFPPWIFKNKIINALHDLGYENLWKLNTREHSPNRAEFIQPEGYDPQSDWVDLVADEFAVFVSNKLDDFKK